MTYGRSIFVGPVGFGFAKADLNAHAGPRRVLSAARISRTLSAAPISRTLFPSSRGHSTMRATGSKYPIVGVVPFVITVDHDDNRGA